MCLGLVTSEQHESCHDAFSRGAFSFEERGVDVERRDEGSTGHGLAQPGVVEREQACVGRDAGLSQVLPGSEHSSAHRQRPCQVPT